MRLGLITLFMLLSMSIMAQQSESFIIQLNDKTTDIETILSKRLSIKSTDLKLKEIFPSLNIYKLTVSNIVIEKKSFLIQLKSIKEITEAEINADVEIRNTPNDTDYQEQLDMNLIGMPDVWNVTQGGKTIENDDIVIAIIDDGFDITHEDLKNSIWINKGETPGNNLDDDNNGYVDDYLGPNLRAKNGEHPNETHGTSVWGIVGAQGNNDLGVSGVNWDTKVMLLSGIRDVSHIIEGYDYILRQRSLYNETNGEQGAFVVASNLSLGVQLVFPSDFPLWCSVYDAIGEIGVLSVGATVNADFNIDELGDMPSSCSSDYLITATNSDIYDEKVIESGYGPINIDLSSPGDGTFTTLKNNNYGEFSGTSSAAPHVAGAIAILYSIPCDNFISAYKQNPAETALTVKRAITSGVDLLPSLEGITSTGGRLNVYNAMLILSNFCDGTIGDLELGDITISQLGNSINLIYETPDFRKYELIIFDAIGRKVYYSEFNPPIFGSKVKNIDITSFNKGVYHAVLRNQDVKLASSFAIYDR